MINDITIIKMEPYKQFVNLIEGINDHIGGNVFNYSNTFMSYSYFYTQGFWVDTSYKWVNYKFL